jgi:hypothetical protein
MVNPFKFILILLFSLLWVNYCSAQKMFTLKQEKNIAPSQTDGEMIGAIDSKSNGETIRFYKRDIAGPAVVSKNHFSGRNMPIVESAIFSENGQKTVLPLNEEITHFNETNIYTMKRDWAANKVVVSNYGYSNGALSKKNSRSFEHAEVDAHFIKNGYLVVSDAIEVGGTTLELSDENLNPVVTYKPMGGYSFFSVDSQKDNIVIASGTTPNLHLAILDKKTGNTKIEKTLLVSGFSISKVFAFEKSIIVYGTLYRTGSQPINEMFCYDLNLNKLWSRTSIMARQNQGVRCLSNADQSKFFYVTASLNSERKVAFKIVCVDSSTGKELWGYDVLANSEVNKNQIGYKYWGFYVTGFEYSIEKNLLVITASNLFENNEKSNYQEYKDGRLIMINDQGKAQESSVSSDGRLFLLKKGGTLKIVGKEKNHSYE